MCNVNKKCSFASITIDYIIKLCVYCYNIGREKERKDRKKGGREEEGGGETIPPIIAIYRRNKIIINYLYST